MKFILIWFLVLLLKIFKWLSYLIFLKILELGNFGFKKEQIFGHQVLMYFRATRLEEIKLKYLVEPVLVSSICHHYWCTFKVWRSFSLSHPLTHTHAHTHTLTHTHSHTPSYLPRCLSYLFYPFSSYSFLSNSYLYFLKLFSCVFPSRAPFFSSDISVSTKLSNQSVYHVADQKKCQLKNGLFLAKINNLIWASSTASRATC